MLTNTTAHTRVFTHTFIYTYANQCVLLCTTQIYMNGNVSAKNQILHYFFLRIIIYLFLVTKRLQLLVSIIHAINLLFVN